VVSLSNHNLSRGFGASLKYYRNYQAQVFSADVKYVKLWTVPCSVAYLQYVKKKIRIITSPLSQKDTNSLHAGDEVLITGAIYTARDAAHKRLFALLEKGKKLPVDLRGQILYYTGPTPKNPKTGSFSAGPTTSSRMDVYTPLLLAKTGLAAMIGKGNRSPAVVDAMKKNRAVYFAAGGGLGALIGKCIKKSSVVCYEDLGPEAIYRFEVENLPVIVAIDSRGKNLYLAGPKKYNK
jgi:fumarate hydratase subunit beta